MELDTLGTDGLKIAQEVLGYLNYSSGAPDPKFLGNVNRLFGLIETAREKSEPTWWVFGGVLRRGLAELHGRSDAFRQVDQAEAVLRLVFEAALPAYRLHHGDLLFRQTDEQLFQPLFVGRVFEAVLQQGGPWNEQDRIVQGALNRLNDFLGHRPVAVLETEQKIQPYAHEYVATIPLYVRGAGVAAGRYQELIEQALAILEETDSTLLFQAFFDPDLLDEVCVDPRAYDFDHPVNKRPNYLFGQWDLNHLDNSGRSRRFVVQQVSLDAMLSRVEQHGKLSRNEILFEAAAVLAGTMLMGAGISGNRPDAHDSTVTLATLVQHIAGFRDAFYEQLLAEMTGPHAQRLREEAVRLRQPLGGARQNFNQRLARLRAEQLQRVNLAELFARMGYTEAATRHIRMVPVASARMMCDLTCRLTVAGAEVDRGQLEQAAALLPEIEDLLHRAIECGALVDPWNILGFGAQYSLFPSPENSVPDHRVDELIDLVGGIFRLYVRLLEATAAVGNLKLHGVLAEGLDEFAAWWDQFASTEVGSVDGISGAETAESAEHVATALRAWHEAETAAGDVAFWRGHVERFRSPKAYALVIEALLEQRDPVAAMALLIQWLSQTRDIPLVDEDYAFQDLSLRWMEDLWRIPPPDDGRRAESDLAPDRRWALTQKFLDYLEANADEYWQVPQFELAHPAPAEDDEATEQEDEEDQLDEDDGDDLFRAAYEHVTYRDTTDDGFEGEIFDGAEPITDFELATEAERIMERLAFLTMLAKLWKLAAVASMDHGTGANGSRADDRRDDVLVGWFRQAMANRRQLLDLLRAVHHYRVPAPRGTHEALVEYDRHQAVREMLTEEVIATCVETADAGRMIRAAVDRQRPENGAGNEELAPWEAPAGQILRALLRGDAAAVRDAWDELTDALLQQPLLYVALARGGNPEKVVTSRGIQHVLCRLLAYLPRLGLLRETTRLIETVQSMELDHPVGPGAITEFDRLFRIGCQAITRCLVVSSEDRRADESGEAKRLSDTELINYLEKTTEAQLHCWLAHSRGVRLSVLEGVSDRGRWRSLKQFIQRYGGDLFTQQFMTFGNLRAILHQGLDAYLASLEEEPGMEDQLRLLVELGGPLPRFRAVHHLEVILEAVVDHYAEYIDYNSTTTQSDRGEMLYTLLDYMRLRAEYDRVAWNLEPVALAHDVLVRCGRDEAAVIWRQAVARRTEDIADDHLRRLKRLDRKYGMRLSSVAGRLGERFIRPLAIDRLRALVRPAVEQLRAGQEPTAFARLEEEIVPFTEESTGSGFEVPAWLDAVQQEAARVLNGAAGDEETRDLPLPITQVRLSADQVDREVTGIADGE